MKTVTISFDLELAKKIQSGEVEGKIVDNYKTEYEIIMYDAKGDYPLVCVYFNTNINATEARTFTLEGKYAIKEEKTDVDLLLEVPEYLTWKEGDYLTLKSRDNVYILVYKSYVKGNMNPILHHVLFDVTDDKLFFDLYCSDGFYITSIQPSTPVEITMLDEALLKDGKKWNPETKQIENVEKKPEHVFKPMDLCLARFGSIEYWNLVQFGYINNETESMISVGGLAWNKWIPYEGNEHLLGTTNKPEE